MVGDILSDLAGAITGSLGMLPSVSLSNFDENGHRCALYEPVHGSAPDIAGQGIANPLAAIMCVGLMFEHSFQLSKETELLTKAIEKVLVAGFRTPDIQAGSLGAISTKCMGDEVVQALTRLNHG